MHLFQAILQKQKIFIRGHIKRIYEKISEEKILNGLISEEKNMSR